MKRIWPILLIVVPIVALRASADRGSVPFNPKVKIFEPNQRAMIAWNGKEEILLLSTDLRASAPTKVLEVIPLPSEPAVKKGDVEVFRRATRLINEKIRRPEAMGRAAVRAKSDGDRPAGEVTFFKKIGAHDVSVTHVLEGRGFVEWVEGYLRRAGVEYPSIPEPLKAVVSEYIQEGFQWFVFDVVELGTKPITNDAIQYRFKTDFLFYPLKITRTEEGDTSIDLLILTPRLLSRFLGIPLKQVNLAHEPVSLTSRELAGLNKEMDALLGHQPSTKLRIWNIRGRLSSFTKDLIVR